MISDALLKNYVDEVFMTYDRDRSGSLEPNELANFFNDVFEKMHNPSRYTIQQANQALRQIDTNFDGRASRTELYNALKMLMSQNGMQNSTYNANSGSSYNSSNQYSQYGNQNTSGYRQQYVTPSSGNQIYNSQQYGGQSYGNQAYSNLSNSRTNLTPQVNYSTGYNYENSKNINSMSQYSTNPSPSVIIPESSYIQTSRVLQPSTLMSNSQPTIISSSRVDPGLTKITTTTGPGYTKITTQTYSTSTTLNY